MHCSSLILNLLVILTCMTWTKSQPKPMVRPDCFRQSDIRRRYFPYQNDPTKFWKCSQLKTPAKQLECPVGTAFLQSERRCVDWALWRWEAPEPMEVEEEEILVEEEQIKVTEEPIKVEEKNENDTLSEAQLLELKLILDLDNEDDEIRMNDFIESLYIRILKEQQENPIKLPTTPETQQNSSSINQLDPDLTKSKDNNKLNNKDKDNNVTGTIISNNVKDKLYTDSENTESHLTIMQDSKNEGGKNLKQGTIKEDSELKTQTKRI